MSEQNKNKVVGKIGSEPADNGINLTVQELGEASKVMIEFLKDWEHTMWASMARKVHLPTLLQPAKRDLLEQQFRSSVLLAFEEDIHITTANGDWFTESDGTRTRIGFADFAVVVFCGNPKLLTRSGVFIRMVLVNDQWLVNPHSMNRRFDPKLADAVREEAESEENENDEQHESEAGSDRPAPPAVDDVR